MCAGSCAPACVHECVQVQYIDIQKKFYIECNEIKNMTDEEVAEYRKELDNIKVRWVHRPKPDRHASQIGQK